MGVLALELSAGSTPTHAALPPGQAGELAALLGRDLSKLAPGAGGLDFSFAAAHFDPAEVLRPGWPLHRRLLELLPPVMGPDHHARLIAFGADAHGNVPLPFQAEPGLGGGSLRVLPFLLSGDPPTLHSVGERLEEALLDTGMAQADTALLAQQAFDAKIEHARYLTVHDLAALVAMQYANQGLQELWPVIETALMAPAEETWLDAPPEPLLRYSGGEAHIALFEAQAWRARYAPEITDETRLERAYHHFQARQQQLAAILEAHGIAVTFAYCPGSDDVRDALRD
ncbi:MAG: hypothetical protein EOP92_27600 [Lysobacteraceae bacterium]|nr:MAG: hypothetical protein EOP92_27600 [Xanthomonadaceae bacterium]